MEIETFARSGNAIASMHAGAAIFAKRIEAINIEVPLLEKAGKFPKNMVDMALARTKTPDE